MANIITTLKKEVEKGNLYIDKKGNTLTLEKIEAMAKKSYVKDLSSGAIGFDKTFDSYKTDILEDYLPVEALIKTVSRTIGYVEESPEMPEPQEQAEEVAN